MVGLGREEEEMVEGRRLTILWAVEGRKLGCGGGGRGGGGGGGRGGGGGGGGGRVGIVVGVEMQGAGWLAEGL